MAIVALVSGGIDSTLMSVLALEKGVKVFPLFIDYGQLAASQEWIACKRIMKRPGFTKIERMSIPGFGRTIVSGITNRRLRLNEDAFLPGRNLLFLLAGAAYASRIGASSVAIGLLNPASHLFPDQTSEFVKTAQKAIEAALGMHITVVTPLIGLAKRDVILMARSKRIVGTYSCHAGGRRSCGVCVACVEISRSGGRI